MRPRVLQLITHLEPGGAQETVILLAEGLVERGFDVTVAAQDGGSEERRLRALDVPVKHVSNLRREISPPSDARAVSEITHLLRDDGFNVVHTHSSKAGVVGRVAARRARLPAIVHTSHGLPVNPDMGRPSRSALIAAERLASRAGHKVVAVSTATARELVDLRLARPSQIEIIPSGVDLRRTAAAPSPEEARRRLGLEPGQPVLGWVGRHFPQKRPDQVVLAAREAVARVPDAAVVLAGDGPMLEETRAAVADEPRIRVLGHRPDVETVYSAIDVMLLASAWEGLPRTVLEAEAAGVPVVSTDVNGIPEIVIHGENGWLAPPGEWGRLGEAAAWLLADGPLRQRMSRSARRRITEFYSAGHMVDATAALYETMLDGHAARRSA